MAVLSLLDLNMRPTDTVSMLIPKGPVTGYMEQESTDLQILPQQSRLWISAQPVQTRKTREKDIIRISFPRTRGERSG